MIELITDPAAWASLVTLIILEIVLGVDNIVFISIISARLPEAQRAKARYIGLAGALILRILLLLSISWLIGLTQPLFLFLGQKISARDLVLLAGGLFLIYKATSEIHSEIDGAHDSSKAKESRSNFLSTIIQIMLVDLVFSIDSIITAIGIADHISIMVIAVIFAVLVMMVSANSIGDFILKHPSTKMLALSFLIMVGMALIADGFHYHIERGFIYSAMGFSCGVEVLNLIRGKRRKPENAETNSPSLH